MTTISDLNEPVSKAPYKKTKAVRFTVLSPDEVRQMSVAHVYKTNTYEDGAPVHIMFFAKMNKEEEVVTIKLLMLLSGCRCGKR